MFGDFAFDAVDGEAAQPRAFGGIEADQLDGRVGFRAEFVDQIVIDTICIPEPVTVCLLGLGALALLRKRRP